jgi:hypothetical protein
MGQHLPRFFVALLFSLFLAAASPADDWNVNGHTYHDVKVIRHDAVNVTILCSDVIEAPHLVQNECEVLG